MLLLLKTFAAIVGMSAIIPLAVWGMSGRWRDGLSAWRTWGLIMGGLAAPGIVVGAIMWLLKD